MTEFHSSSHHPTSRPTSRPTGRRRPAAGQPSPREAYITEFRTRLTAHLRRTRPFDDIDDIVSREVTAVWEHIDARMATFPNASIYAHVRATGDRAVIGHQRSERAQRGEGARGGRKVTPFDELRDRGNGKNAGLGTSRKGTDPDEFLTPAYHGNPIDDFLNQFDTDEQLRAALLNRGLNRRQREVLYLVDGQGYSVTEVAEQMGLARETVSRARSAAYRSLGLQPPC